MVSREQGYRAASLRAQNAAKVRTPVIAALTSGGTVLRLVTAATLHRRDQAAERRIKTDRIGT